MLSILRDPGEGTLDQGGSGMLCVENDDQTAESMHGLMESAGLQPSDFTPWNAYPRFIDRAPTPDEVAEASPTLVGLLELPPDLEVVLLQGNDAHSAWRIAVDAQPAIRRRRLIMVETYHPSVQALQASSSKEREHRKMHRLSAWREARAVLS